MADSFFGFDSALSNLNERDDGGGGLEASEDEYDALNDETFGEAGEDGDWEQQHEELLLSENDKQGQDLEAFLSHLVLEDYDDYNSPRGSPQQKARENKSNAVAPKRNTPSTGYTLPMQQTLPQPPMSMPSLQQNVTTGQGPHPGTWLKNACTVEELERSMRQQPQPPPQSQPQHHIQHQIPLIMPFYQPRFPPGVMPPSSGPPMGIQNHSLPHQHQHPHMPPGFGGPPPHHPHHFSQYNQMAPLSNGMMPQSILPRPPQPQSQSQGQAQTQPPPQPGSLQAIEHQQQQQQQQQNSLHHPLQNQNQNQIIPQQGQNIWQQPPQNMIPNLRMPLNNIHPLQQQMQSMPPPLRPINSSGGPPMQNVNNVMGQNLQMGPHAMMNRPPNAHRPQMNQINQNQPQQVAMNQKGGNLHQPNHQQHHFHHHQQQTKQGPVQPNSTSNNGQGNRPFNNQGSFESNESLIKNINNLDSIIQMIHDTHPILQKLAYKRPNDQESNDRYYNSGSRNMQQQRNRLNPEDQYSGLMSNREKQWLLNIQLLQLNTGTPYQDDYYYTVFLDRQAKKEKLEVKDAHKANQQNHPFSQQNLTNNRYHGSGDGGRERRNSNRSNSESNNVNKEGPRPHYVPTQFENSLGKLQCGSVTAPRKIIDMEVVGPEEIGNTSVTSTSSVAGTATPAPIGAVGGASRGARQTLLAIEALYRQLLKVEDLSEPLAIANALVLKEREEKQKALLLEQQREALERNGSTEEEPPVADVPSNHFLRGIESVRRQAGETITVSSNASAPPPSLGSAAGPRVAAAAVITTGESETELMGGLLAGLLHDDKLAAIVNVRKGKTLVVRILTQAIPTDRWRAPLGRLWPRLLRTLPAAVRRDSALLSPLSDLFRQYLSGTEGWAPVSDLCLTLTEGAPATLPRSATPAPQQRSIMHFLITTQLGLSLLSELAWRACALPQPAPAAWCRLARVSARLAPSPPLPHSATPLRPMQKPLPATLVAGLAVQEVESFTDLLCGS